SYLQPTEAPPPGAAPMAVFELNTAANGEGHVVRLPSDTSYISGAEVELRAVGAPGWEFYKWEGDHGGTANPTTILMEKEQTIVAHFRRSFDAWKESQF